jgi:hypothetical protein
MRRFNPSSLPARTRSPRSNPSTISMVATRFYLASGASIGPKTCGGRHSRLLSHRVIQPSAVAAGAVPRMAPTAGWPNSASRVLGKGFHRGHRSAASMWTARQRWNLSTRGLGTGAPWPDPGPRCRPENPIFCRVDLDGFCNIGRGRAPRGPLAPGSCACSTMLPRRWCRRALLTMSRHAA